MSSPTKPGDGLARCPESHGACLHCHQSLKHCPLLPQHWLPSWGVRKASNWKQGFTSWFGGSSAWKSAAKKKFSCISVFNTRGFCFQLLNFPVPFFHAQRKGLAGLPVLTKSPLSKWMALKKSPLIEASSLHQAELEKKKTQPKTYIFSVNHCRLNEVSNYFKQHTITLSCNINSERKHPRVQQ